MRKNFMCIGVSILVLAAQIQTHAYDVWVVPAQPISEEKMNRIIKDLPQEVLQNEVHPYTDNQLRNSISEQVRDSLSQLAVKGESESRLGHEKEALLAYENILLTLRDRPLSQGLNKLIIFALLKSAEIYEKKGDHEKSGGFMRRAFVLEPHESPSWEIHSASVIKQFESQKKKWLKEKMVKVSVVAPTGSHIYLDGVKIKKDALTSLKVYAGQHRWSVLIPGSRWQVSHFDVESKLKPLHFVFKPDPLASGDCTSPQLLHAPELAAQNRLLVIYDGGHCPRVYDGESWFDLKGNGIDQARASWYAENLARSITTERPKTKSIWQSTWFWLGVGAVAGAAIYFAKQNEGTGAPVPSQNHY